MWIDRDISDKVRRAAQQFPAIALTGARQTGKTSLLKHLFPTHSYASLDDPNLAAQAEDDTDTFLQLFPAPVIVDEVQYAPKLFRRLKIAIDQKRHSMGQYILTGSQKFTLMHEVSDSLAGRCAIMELLSLSCPEIARAQLLADSEPNVAFDHMSHGYSPELWRNREADQALFFGSYLATYLERDVRQILNVGSLRDYSRFMRACALRSGQILNKSELAKDVGVTLNTVNAWLSVLEASNQISLLEPYFNNKRKQLVKSPKIYFHDPGFLCYLLGLDAKTLPTFAGIGSLWETLIFAELSKLIANSKKTMRLWFYGEHKKYEIDFLLEAGGRIHALEVKFTADPTVAMTENLQRLADDFGEQVASKWLVSRIQHPRKVANGTHLVHGLLLGQALTKNIDESLE